MAKIYLNIEADDPNDLHQTLIGLVNAKIVIDSGDDNELVEQAQGEQPAKRTRRTKAQIEADNAAQSAANLNNTVGSATGAQPGSQANSDSTQQQSSSGSGAGSKDVDPFADQIKRSAAEPEITQVQVRAAATKFMSSHTAKELQAILVEHGGAPNIGAVEPANYAAVIAALEAAG